MSGQSGHGTAQPESRTPVQRGVRGGHAALPPEASVQIRIGQGNREAIVSPFGASLRGYGEIQSDGSIQECVTCYAGASRPGGSRGVAETLEPGHTGQKLGGQGDVLIPFPGRIREGAYTFEGEPFQLQKNDAESPAAIHGFLRSRTWETRSATENQASFATTIPPTEFPGYPFSLSAEVSYRVDDEGLTCLFRVGNTGSRNAPVGVGFHPYFTTGSTLINADTLELPFRSMLEFEGFLPTGAVIPVEGSLLDFSMARKIGEVRINNCFLDPERGADGRVTIRLSNAETGRSVSVWMDQAFDFVVLYSGDPLPAEHRRRSLAIEPMTCGSDAFNHAEWGLTVLLPGEAFSGAWGVRQDAG